MLIKPMIVILTMNMLSALRAKTRAHSLSEIILVLYIGYNPNTERERENNCVLVASWCIALQMR